MASESLHSTPEFIEPQFGEAVTHRTSQLHAIVGLGPPDLCCLHKVYERPYVPLLNRPSRTSYFHHVLGLNTCNPAFISTYFQDLINAMEPASWFANGQWRVESGCYCCYDAFSKVDVRVEVTIPGGVRAYTMDSTGRRSDHVNEDVWKRAHVSSVLRALVRPPPHIPCLVSLSPFETTREEELFLRDVAQLHDLWWKVGSENPAEAKSLNRVATVLRTHFLDSFRYTPLISFFQPLLPSDPLIATHIARAYRCSGHKDQAFSLLAQALESHPDSVCLLGEQAELLLEEGQLEFALPLARYCVQLGPTDPRGWFLLAQTYLASGALDLALIALNVTPMPLELDESPRSVLVGDKRTYPAHPQETFEEPEEREVEDEPEDDDTPPQFLLPGNALKGKLAEAYSLLVSMVNATSWDAVLDARATVFSLETDGDGNEGRFGGSGESAKEVADDEHQQPVHCKRLCTRWLDSLFHALYEDLTAFASWRLSEDGGEQAKGGKREWLARGLLANRLHRHEEAEMAYSSALREGWSQRACRALLDHYAQSGRVPEALAAANNLLIKYFGRYPTLPPAKYPKQVVLPVFRLISVCGMGAVRPAFEALVAPHPSLQIILEDAVKWDVHGASQ